ncbi:MAG: ribonuclease H-like domain-containing protein [archaeon]
MNLSNALKNCPLLITYNGIKHDIPKINSEFQNIIPKNIPVIDIYRFSRRLGFNTNLKVLENTFNISRLKESSKKRRIATKLWREYLDKDDLQALEELLEYNKQDTINLYFLAEKLSILLKEKGELMNCGRPIEIKVEFLEKIFENYFKNKKT